MGVSLRQSSGTVLQADAACITSPGGTGEEYNQSVNFIYLYKFPLDHQKLASTWRPFWAIFKGILKFYVDFDWTDSDGIK